MFDFKDKSKGKTILIMAMVIILSLLLQSNAYAKLVKDAEGADRVSLNFTQDENFEVKNLITSDKKQDYNITFKKDGLSKTGQFSASTGDSVNINLEMGSSMPSVIFENNQTVRFEPINGGGFNTTINIERDINDYLNLSFNLSAYAKGVEGHTGTPGGITTKHSEYKVYLNGFKVGSGVVKSEDGKKIFIDMPWKLNSGDTISIEIVKGGGTSEIGSTNYFLLPATISDIKLKTIPSDGQYATQSGITKVEATY